MKKLTLLPLAKHFAVQPMLWGLAFLLQCGLLSAQCSPDVVSPVIACPSNVTVNVAPGICFTAVSLVAPTVSDNCPGTVIITSNAPANGIFPLGTTSVQFTATDAAGNTATCVTTVTVTGGAVYTIICNDLVTLSADPSGFTTIVPADILEGGPYNCVNTFISLFSSNTPQASITIAGAGDFQVKGWVAIPGGGYNSCWGTLRLTGIGVCSPDVIPPTAVCKEAITIQTNLSGPNITIVPATQINEGSQDACSSVILRATDNIGATTPPTASSVTFTTPGVYNMALWVGDAAGNWNQCITEVTVVPPACTPDVTPPSCIAPPNLTLTSTYYQSLNLNLQDSLQMIAAFGAVSHWDNCSNGNSLVLAAYSVVTYANGSPKTITRSFLVIDNAGNPSIVATQVIHILPSSSTVHLPAWSFPGDTVLDSMLVQSQGPELLASSFSDQYFKAACNNEKVRIERTYTFINWLTYNPNLTPIEIPALDLNNDGRTGDAFDAVFYNDSLWLVVNGALIRTLAPKFGSYQYTQDIRFNYLDTVFLSVTGTVFLDTLANCTYDLGETRLANWRVKAIATSGTVYTGLTNEQGVYEIFICLGDTVLEVGLDVPFQYHTSCPTIYNNTIQQNQPGIRDIPVLLEESCPLLSIDLSTQRIRPCFPGVYKVSYCNLSNQPVANVQVEVVLDDDLQFNGAGIPGSYLGNNTFNFPIGLVAAGACGSFNINFLPNCNAPVGMTHCSEARITPDSLCAGQVWLGALLEATALCDADSVRLSLRNVGPGNMSAPLEFVVVEDLIMYMSNPFQLASGEKREVAALANGATWRISAPQESGYPWGGIAAAFIEGCGGLNQSGASLAFPLASSNPFEAIDCMVSVSSFDPNDKQAVPTGYGTSNQIEANTDIQYTLRFQNTGTDTAYTVVLLDTISGYLDRSSLITGASSHSYDFDVLEGNVLRFRFDRINLPDSSTNLIASQGFVKYRIGQQADNPIGTQILNHADIYFDYNAPIRTNTTLHTIGKDFIMVDTDTEPGQDAYLKVYPNPGVETVFFECAPTTNGGTFTLIDALGRTVRSERFSGNRYRFERKALPAGVYYFNINGSNGTLLLK